MPDLSYISVNNAFREEDSDTSFLSVAPDSPINSRRKSTMKYKEMPYFNYVVVTLIIYFL